ncbi:hypothetical protein V1460_30310 [Streptomyces sp. SCSIO 30461]|uniref:hypothetical protein n=1 Tax=Streptomyces sp. SCSIO 30461 TaxID=3118085 RepID=UPI0030CBDE25
MSLSTAPHRITGPGHPDRDLADPISAQFHNFDARHPWIYRLLERLVAERVASGAQRVGMKALFEALRWSRPYGVKGLNNNYTALYARKLLTDHPEWAPVIELRRRRKP